VSASETADRLPVVVFGTGVGADIARRYLESDSDLQIAAYVVDRAFLREREFQGRPVVALDEVAAAYPPGEVQAFVPLGASRMSQARVEKFAALKGMGYRFATYIHSSNSTASRATIGENCFILENQSFNFETAVGDNVVIWSGCQIGDRSRIGDHAFLASHVVLNGDVEIGERVYLGSNCNISNYVKVGALSFIGANALITRDTAERAVHVVEATPAAGIDSLRFVRLLKDH
jgi:sugar O-acyltransferase (sialic acid O-acetyltransferase NeuD family)